MLDKGNKEAREISNKAGDIYNSVCTVAENLMKLGSSLNAASNHYDKTVTAISGKRGLHGKVERFTQLSSKASKTMPSELEPRNLAFEVSQLDVQPLAVEQSHNTTEVSDKKAD
jgi:DNA recombination protein RmuC